jgi:hypothetical protein
MEREHFMTIIMPELADRAEEVFPHAGVEAETEDETASDEDSTISKYIGYSTQV